MARLCLVTPSHLSSNPRLVKAAGALCAAGHDVHVVAHRYFPSLDETDAALFKTAPWKHTVVDSTRGLQQGCSKLRRRLLRFALSRGFPLTPGNAGFAHHAVVPMLVATAARVPADLYVGHCLAGLAAAAQAAHLTRTRYAFDAEDFHSAETETAVSDHLEHRIVTTLEAACLPGCAAITASSPLIARAYRETYQLPDTPSVVLNTFPLDQGPAASSPSPGGTLRLYWFSQTIGSGRGLEPLVATLGRMKQPASLHLRGLPSSGFPETLRALARQNHWSGEIEFLPFATPADMPRLAAGYHLGLSLELRTPRNRDLCLTNKIFTYLLAGLPVALSSTSAQDALLPDLGRAALTLPLDDPAAGAALLDLWWSDRAAVAAARAHAWHLGQTRYNWDHEKTALVATIEHALS
ncbi:MAG: hypothetical protein H7Y06_02590 [Opitutaceae bacterium]|nr:hypothetical protein [Opitutaceae bacterium]